VYEQLEDSSLGTNLRAASSGLHVQDCILGFMIHAHVIDTGRLQSQTMHAVDEDSKGEHWVDYSKRMISNATAKLQKNATYAPEVGLRLWIMETSSYMLRWAQGRLMNRSSILG
jgi:hypothetical protein